VLRKARLAVGPGYIRSRYHLPILTGPVVSYGPFSLCVIHKEGLCSCSVGINRLMMMMMNSMSGYTNRSNNLIKFVRYLKVIRLEMS
jgi:hypothetical protein